MICFHFTIFVVLETTQHHKWKLRGLLWFAFILLSLSYWKQHLLSGDRVHRRCDLLSFYYLCRTGNNLRFHKRKFFKVVICFHFTIFVVLETTSLRWFSELKKLWFAFILLSLSYWKQRAWSDGARLSCCDLLSFYYLCRTGNNKSSPTSPPSCVVICFHFTIFVVLETTPSGWAIFAGELWFAFILLSLSYWKQHV